MRMYLKPLCAICVANIKGRKWRSFTIICLTTSFFMRRKKGVSSCLCKLQLKREQKRSNGKSTPNHCLCDANCVHFVVVQSICNQEKGNGVKHHGRLLVSIWTLWFRKSGRYFALFLLGRHFKSNTRMLCVMLKIFLQSWDYRYFVWTTLKCRLRKQRLLMSVNPATFPLTDKREHHRYKVGFSAF